MSQKILDKLEEYEQLAYDGGYGDEWLESVGEGFKFYIKDCITENVRPSINGFVKYLNGIASKDCEQSEFNERLKMIKDKIKSGNSSSIDHSLAR